MPDLAISPTPEHDEGPSLSTGHLPGQPPATGLRLPPLRNCASHSYVEPGRAGGERLDGTPLLGRLAAATRGRRAA